MKNLYAFDVSKLKIVSKEPDLNKRSIRISVIFVQIYSLPLYPGKCFIVSYFLGDHKKLGLVRLALKR